MGPGRARHIEVACAVIERDGRVLCTQRSAAMSLPLKWEFPGGKIKPGEGPEECLRREVLEELGVAVDIRAFLAPVTYDYPAFSVTLHPYLCTLREGTITLHEHAAMTWQEPDRLGDLDWAAADLPIIQEYQAIIRIRTS
jgi:8-oxo-dGTP diphosphatase